MTAEPRVAPAGDQDLQWQKTSAMPSFFAIDSRAATLRAMSAALVVMAKEPLPGRVKTRLCPPLEPAQAAQLAEAALVDTLDAVGWTPARRRVVALDGAPGPWLAPGFEVIAQRGEGLAERLANATRDVGEPLVFLGMDTPQVTRALLIDALQRLAEADAVLGPTTDGGYWTIGLARPDPTAFEGVPMSTAATARAQRERLAGLGLKTAALPPLRDVDTWEDAVAVAAQAPWTRFAATLELLSG
jgi:rSAM/selenodomain-associated transferase 1